MNLITVLLALAVESRLGDGNKYRRLDWFDRYRGWLELRLGRTACWDGVAGTLITLFIPLFLPGLAAYLLVKIHFLAAFLFSLVVLIYSLGPGLNSLLHDYIDALDGHEDIRSLALLNKLSDENMNTEAAQRQILNSIMIKAHENLFAVIFWFFLLGPIGALLYCLVRHLFTKYDDIHGGYADAVRDLHDILMWPSVRLYALGFALGGSLVDAFEGWRTVSGHTLDVNYKVLTASGLGALQYAPESEPESAAGNAACIGWLREAQALINRALVVWLIVIGVLTIGGWIA